MTASLPDPQALGVTVRGILYEGEFTLTTEHLAELAYLAAQGRKALGIEKQRAEHAADDVLWSLGWCVMNRVPIERRVTA